MRYGRFSRLGACLVLLGVTGFAAADAEGDEQLLRHARLAADGPGLLAFFTQRVARAAAGVALCRAAVSAQMPAVRKLLEDTDPVVRMRVALALAVAREKDAVPVLIGLLNRLGPQERGVVVDLLYRLAEDKAPTVVF